MTRKFSVAAVLTFSVLLGSFFVLAQWIPAHQHPMTFFVTSVNIGNGGNLGGLAGADAHCQALAAGVGAGNHTWHAYLSTQARGDQPAINARDRIGGGNTSWNSSHPTRNCSQEDLASTGGAGLYDCFATN